VGREDAIDASGASERGTANFGTRGACGIVGGSTSTTIGGKLDGGRRVSREFDAPDGSG